jgi:hypothetical protein
VNQAVRDILDRIEQLPAEDRLAFEDQIARQAEAEWQREVEDARRLAHGKGIDQEVMGRAIERVRHGQGRSPSTSIPPAP